MKTMIISLAGISPISVGLGTRVRFKQTKELSVVGWLAGSSWKIIYSEINKNSISNKSKSFWIGDSEIFALINTDNVKARLTQHFQNLCYHNHNGLWSLQITVTLAEDFFCNPGLINYWRGQGLNPE